MTKIGWTPPEGGMSAAQWKDALKKVLDVEGAVHWVLGDMLVYGMKCEYGDITALAAELGCERQYLWDLCSVSRAYESSLRNEVLSWSHHRAAMALRDANERSSFLANVAAKRLSFRDTRLELYRAHKRARHIALSNAAALDLDRPFPLIYADPPWPYETHSDLGKVMTSPDNHYETMTIDEICDLVVGDKHITEIVADNCALFLCCTSANMICMAQEVWKAWGFEYSSQAVWVKDRPGTGHIFRNQHEIIVYARRGNVPKPIYAPSSVFSYPRGAHSAKPPEIRQALEQMYPEFGKADRIELFARGYIPGWTTWGNEALQEPPTIGNVVPVEPKLEESVKELFLSGEQKQKAKLRAG
jgi:N6-adenosine-specific RNA methylase IME4